MGRARGANTETALAFESTYGTTPASGFFRVPFVTNTLGATRGMVEDDLLGLGRDPQAPTQDVIDANGDITIPMDLNNLGHWLKALFGAPTTTGTDPYTHVFESGGATLPSMSVEKLFPDVPLYEMVEGVKANTFGFTMNRGRGNKLTAQLGLMAQGSADDTSSNAGTPTEMALERFTHAQGAISRDSTALGNVLTASVNYTNNLDPFEPIRSDSKVGGFDAGVAACTGDLTIRFDSTTLRDQAESFSSCALSMDWEISTNKKLTIALPRVYLQKPKIEVSGPAGIDVTFPYMAAQQTNGDPMVTATLINSVSSY